MNLLQSGTKLRRLLLVGIAVYAISVVVVLVQLRSYEIAGLVAFGAYVLVGGLIVVRRSNVIGLMLVAYGSAWAAGLAALVTAEGLDDAGRTGAAGWAALIGLVVTTPTSWLIAGMWLVFPDGRTHSATDRRLLRWSGALAIFATVASVFSTPQVLPESEAYPHPFVDEDVAEVLRVSNLIFGLLLLFGYFTAVKLIVRMRHGDPVERRQVRWIALAVIAFTTIIMANLIIAPLDIESRAFLLIDSVAIILIPLAVGVAITRYRLYEIDRIISRSVTYGVLAVFIGGVYVATVVGLGQLLGGDTGFGLSIVATVVVAIAFQPVRRRVDRWANRLVYGERATPHEVLVRFSHRSSELSDEQLMARVPQLIVDGTDARVAALWVRTADGFETASSWPPDVEPRSLPGHDEFSDPEADRSLSVFHDGELFGGLSLTKEEGESVTPAEAALLADLAAGLGLALRNAQLTGELRRQVAELEASRERVLAAADAARRELENTLDSGPQQQLVALKVKLGPTRKRAEQLGASKTAGLLTQLEQQAGDAIAAIREFAGGIYPPLLEAEGLTVAIGQQARTAALPVSVRGDDLVRYSREIESAVYFTVLEALQNATKYANADSVVVHLAATNGALEFEITDDGDGFNSSTVMPGSGLNGIADRLDTVGGRHTVDSVPGRGTTIAGAVPIGRHASI